MKRAVNQWCFEANVDLKEIFRVAQDAQLDGVELNIYEPGEIGLTLATQPAEALAIKSLAKSYGLELPSLSNGLLWKWPLSSKDAEIRSKGASIVKRQLELAHTLEMDTILVVPGMVTDSTSYEECWQRSQDEIGRLATHAEQLGVRIGIENVWNKFLLSPVEMVRFIDDIGSKHVGAYFDVGNVLNFGYPEHWITSLGHRILKVHVKDFNTRVGNIQGFVPLLSGDVNWHAVRHALTNIGYDDYITAEQSPYTGHGYQMIYDASVQMKVIAELHNEEVSTC